MPPFGPVHVRWREQAQKLSEEAARGLVALVDEENVTGRYFARVVERLELACRARFALPREAAAVARLAPWQ
jgi:hypothetical protein